MIRVLLAISGRTDGHNLEVVGSIHNLNPAIEEQLVAQGYAEWVHKHGPREPDSEPDIETAEAAPHENAAKRTTKPKPRATKR